MAGVMQGRRAPGTRGVRPTPAAPAKSSSSPFAQALVSDGKAGAVALGETARVHGVKDSLVVPGERLAQDCELTRQYLAPAEDRGEVFAVKIDNRLHYPLAFLGVDRETLATGCRALGDLDASETLMFWPCDTAP
ncbi:hypothetical protein [Leptothrix cholodnii]|uniref:hypothetical protein n=1 Tax=Leptothrix cholodnii TaxID=34029 RepID=UPI00123718EF|nr:hypothetical protein [Leptothrix cholodnii]